MADTSLSSTPYMSGGTEVKRRLKKIKTHELVIVLPEKPQKNWYQNNRFTYICMKKEEEQVRAALIYKIKGCMRNCVNVYITHHILVEEIEDHVSQPCVAPMTVNQNELSQELKSRDGKVTGHHCLYIHREKITNILNAKAA